MPKLRNFKRTQRKTAKSIRSTASLPSEFSQKKIGKKLRSTKGIGDQLAKLSDMSGVESRSSKRPKSDVFNQIGL